MFKSYTRRSSAIVGAKRAGIDEAAVTQHEGKWGFFLPDAPAGGSRLPKLGGGAGTRAVDPEITIKAAATVAETISSTTISMMDKVNDTLGDIKEILFKDLNREEERHAQEKLRQLEEDRERADPETKNAGASFMENLRDKAGGLLGLLKALSLPAVIGAIAALDKKFDFLSKAREKIERWAGKLQNDLTAISELPLFKDNILGTGIKNLLPIAGAFAAFALWKPALAVKVLTGAKKFIDFFGKNPSIKGLEKLGSALPALEKFGKFGPVLQKFASIGGKIFLPITVITSLWETVKGAIDGWETGGFGGMLKGALDGLVHGLIGGLVETLSQGIGWVLEQFGVEAEGFKNFKFGMFLEELGSNLGVFVFDLVDSVKRNFSEAVAGIASIFASESSFVDKMKELVTFPLTFIVDKFREAFAGKSLREIITDMMSFVTANNAIGRAAEAASKPGPTDAQGGKPEIILITPDTIDSNRRPPSRSLPQASISSRVSAGNVQKLEAEARAAGMTDEQIAYAYETDRMIGAPKGASLAQIKQESGFNSKARSQTGAVGLTQFTSIAVKDVMAQRRGVDPSKISDEEVQREKASLMGNSDKALEYHRELMMIIQKRRGSDWLSTMRSYNGDVKIEKNGRQARDNYIDRIAGHLGVDDISVPKRTSATALVQATEEVNDARIASTRGTGSVNVSPVNASRTNVSTQVQNHLPNLSASTPVEFAPHVL